MIEIDKSYHERKIKSVVGCFFVGSIAFVSLEFLLIYLGTMTFTHPELDWPSSFVIMGLGGLYLLWQMPVAQRYWFVHWPKYRCSSTITSMFNGLMTKVSCNCEQGNRIKISTN